jgi:outer membrane lipoprotein-sorting protein
LRQRDASVRTLRARTKVDHLGSQGRVKGTVYMLVERGGRLRFDAVSPFGSPLGTLVSDGREFAFHDVERNRFLTGEATPCNISRLLRIAMPGEQVAAILLGGAPLLPATVATAVSWDSSTGSEVLVLTGADGSREELRFDGRDRVWDLHRAELRDRRGQLVFRLEHDEPRQVSGARMPLRTAFEAPATMADVRLRFDSQAVNIDLADGLFRLEAPTGIAAERVSCGD